MELSRFAKYSFFIFISIYTASCKEEPEGLSFGKYNMHTILEKNYSEYAPFYGLDSLKYSIFPNPFAPSYAWWYKVPRIMHVDSNENIYLNMPGRIEVLDRNGNFKLLCALPPGFDHIDYFSWDEVDLYIFLKRNYYDAETQIWRINTGRAEFKMLSAEESGSLSPELLPPAQRKEYLQIKRHVRSITDKNGIFYGEAWSMSNKPLLSDSYNRFIDPAVITIFRFDSSLNREYGSPLPGEIIDMFPETYVKYIYDTVHIGDLFPEKLICIGSGNSYIDKAGNVYLDGIKSSDADRTYNEKGNPVSIEVGKPIFFLIKLENKHD